jgi:RNA polymerase sigma factor (sigma-70 family)
MFIRARAAPPHRPRSNREEGVLNLRELNDTELAELAQDSEERLLAYIVEARDAERIEAAVTAAQVLAYRYERQISGFVFNQLGSKGPLVVEEVAERTISDAIGSAAGFAGMTVPEFRGWIYRIARRRIADYHRKGRVDEIPLEVRTEAGETREREIRTGDPTEVIDRTSVINQALDELNEVHREVVIRVRFRRLSHKKTADEVNRHFGNILKDPMTEQNVNQINSRFGKRLDELLEEADDPPPPDDHDG